MNKFKEKPRKRPTKGKVLFEIFKWTIFVVYGFISVLPMYWMVVNSFKTHPQIYADIDSFRTFLPPINVGHYFDSYVALFNEFDLFGRAVCNSLLYAVIMIVLVLAVNSFAGYALARFRFPGNRVIETFIILLLIVPIETSVVPLYVILYKLNLLNTAMFGSGIRIVAYVIPSIASPFNTFLFRQFFLGLPSELEDAASIDGCGKFGTFFKIIFPLSLVSFAMVTIFTFMGVWNDYLWPQLIFTEEKLFPVQVFLQQVNNRNPKDISLVMASLTFSTLPIVIVYVSFQKYLVEGVGYTGLKI